MNAEELFDNATMAFVDGNNEEALKLYSEAAELGYLDAIKLLAEAYEQGNKLSLIKDDKIALNYYKKAASLGDFESFNKILDYPNISARKTVIEDILNNEASFRASSQIIAKIHTIKEGLSLKEYELIEYSKYGMLEFVLCLPGSFIMGSNADEFGRSADEIPHKVTITKAFLIAKYPVTQRLYELVMGENPSAYKGEDNPVELVSFKQATEFCRKLTSELIESIPKDYMFNIPTEAQWEYACKAGNEQCDIDLSDYKSDKQTHSVKEGKPNGWNVCDMLGNVSEWCRSWYYSYDTREAKDPSGPMLGKLRVSRGGSYKEKKNNLRAAKRYTHKCGYLHSESSSEIGFRIILESIK